ncbi:MAG: phage tail tape measure protein [Winogradskyella sp.]|nr:phage tail tape measure protein [Winogradskyella sp.]|tara:strand:+ start:35209 stop:39384 length:4176 start_codon:yes stop_codon:yes gene_type:complete
MAKRIVDEEMRFTVIVNGNSAQKELYDLEKRNRALTASNKDLRAERAKLAAEGKKNTAEYKALTAEIKQNNTVITANKARMQVLQQQIGVTGLTMRQLQQRASQLRLQLRNMVPGSAEYKRYQNDLQKVNTQLAKLRGNAKATESSLSKVANGFNKYAALGASIIATGTGVVLSLQKMIDYNGQLSDAQSNVQKTTGLTKKEVDELTKSFGAFKTRTARIELLQLAEEAGRLGKSGVDDVKAFVKVANQLKVALGDDLGEEQIREVGKMVTIYKVGQREGKNFEEAMLALGSSINEVSASGANQASFLVDFIKRTAGISDVANISAQDMIGLAAAFDEAGQSQEISATAINKFFGSAASDVQNFAKVAGVSVKEYSRLLEQDANQALILFLKGLKQGNPSLEEMQARLEGIELGGTRGTQAIGALAANIENLEAKQKIANDSLKEATSLTNEYNLKNNNLAASLEKIQKRVQAAFSSETVVKALSDFVEWFSKFIGASEDADGSVTRFRNRLVALLKTVIIITAAVLSYNTALKLSVLWTNNAWKATKLYNLIQKITTVSTNTLKGATLLLKAAMLAATGNIKKASAAMRLFNTITKLSPVGLLVGVLTAVAAAYVLFSESSEKAANAQDIFNDATKEAEKNTAKTIKQKQLLLQVAQDETLSLKQRQEAIDELNRTVPEYNNQLSLETVNTTLAKEALDKHIESLKQSAITYVLQERIKKKAVELADLESSALKDNVEWYNYLWAALKNGANMHGAVGDVNKQATKNKYESIEATKEEIKVLEELYKTQLKNNPDQSSSGESGPKEGDTKTIGGKTFIYKNGKWTVQGGGYVPPKGNDTSKVDQAKKEAELLLKLQRETEDKRIALIEDAFVREMTQSQVNQKRKLQDLGAQSDEILEAYDKALTKGDTDLASTLLDQYHELYDQIELLDEEFNNSRSDILGEGIEAHLEKLKAYHISREQQLLTAHNNELAALGDNEDAKKALQDKFNKEKLEREKALQVALISELQNVLNATEFKGFDLSILTEDQKQAIVTRLQELGLELSEINLLLDKMRGSSTGNELDGLGIDSQGRVDILGMNDEQWAKVFERTETLSGLIGKVGMVAQAGVQAFSMYDQFVTASENKKLQRLERNAEEEIAKQDRLLANKLISQKQHDDAVAAEEKKLRKAQAEMEYKQAKRQKAMNVASILSNQAVAISKALAQGGFVLGIPWAAIVGTMAGIQLALALAQPLPAKGFEKGFYDNTVAVRREQDGKVFNAAYGGESRSGVVDKPTMFLAGEGGKNFPELIISGPDLKQFDPNLKQSLYREIGRVKGYEDGYYKNVEGAPINDDDRKLKMMMISALNRYSDVLERIEENGLEAYVTRNFTNAKRLRDDINRLEKIESKSKINT